MSRDDGFLRADIDVGYLDDEKVRKLWRVVEPDVGLMCECLMVHQATVLAGWREGRRVTVYEAAPLWLPASPAFVAPLMQVGLLDRTKRIPARSFKKWIGPAIERRGKRAEAGRVGGLASAQKRAATSGKRPPSNRSRSLNPASQPAIQPTTRAGARAGGAPARLGDLIGGLTFLEPDKGKEASG